jgi:hypothetical protein
MICDLLRTAAVSSLLASVGLAAGLSPAFAAQNMPMAAHRATYDLVLAEGAGKGGVESARGRIVFEFNGSACEGYTLNFRQVTELSGGDIGTKLSDMRSSTFEAGDGSSLRFNTESRTPPGPAEATDGTAQRGNGKIVVELRKPERAKLDLPDAVFPTAQMKMLIDAAKAGKSTLETRVYDGSEKARKAYDTFAVIGKAADTAAEVEEPLRTSGWDKMPRWPVSISYFEEGGNTQQPVYVISFELLENGVSRKLKLDYGDFGLTGDLKRLEVLNTPACDK